ncbi:MAG: gliding motility-associated C-terminal domain-containing protein, partial [Bacteroidia bacterium]|nr:gliding motility-associated C-terminal domain-containing protein [Bacteroidia bacterium]
SGTPPFTYQWMSESLVTIGTNQDISMLYDSTYYVLVTDINGCSAIDSTSLELTDGPVLVLIPESPTAAGNDGNINLIVVGGSAPYIYTWSNGETIQDIDSLTYGWYIVTVVDGNNCVSIDSVEILPSSAGILQVFMIPEAPACQGDSSGSIDLIIIGGAHPYSIEWSNGETAEDIDSLQSGIYTVTITDAINNFITDSVLIGEPAVMTIILQGEFPTCNNGDDGYINLFVMNGEAPYNFIWSNDNTTQNLTGIAAGMYSVSVTDQNGCDAISSIIISEPPAIVIDVETYEPSCYIYNNGKIDISVYNAIFPLSYLWSQNGTTQDITGLPAGIYSVTITDYNGCTTYDSIVLSEPDEILLTFEANEPTCAGINDGSIDLTVTNGIQPFSYLWNDALSSTSEDIENLAEGVFTVIVFDSNGCQKTDSTSITNVLTLDITLAPTPPTCLGINNGSINSVTINGTEPYYYQWNDIQSSTTQNISGLGDGTYMLMVTDSNGCTGIDSITLNYIITVTLDLTTSNPSCFGIDDGGLIVTAQNGSSPYAFEWSDPEIPSNDTVTGLSAGEYFVTVTDAFGCQAIDSAQISNIEEILLNGALTDSYCNSINSGAISITTTGGTPPYVYEWEELTDTTSAIDSLYAGIYMVTVTDSNNCMSIDSFEVANIIEISLEIIVTDPACYHLENGNINITVSNGNEPYQFLWSDGNSSEDNDSLGAGTYTLTIVDDSSCYFIETTILNEPENLEIHSNITEPLCFNFADGSVEIEISGGIAPYSTFGWSDGSDTIWSSATEDTIIENLSSGDYIAIIYDNNGCMTHKYISVGEPDSLIITNDIIEFACYGSPGSISIGVEGGTGPYTYLWITGETTQMINNLVPGIYYITVIDNNECITVDSVELTQAPQIIVSDTAINPSCYGFTNGGINITVTGGIIPYLFKWYINGEFSGYISEDMVNAAEGEYVVQVSDSTGCYIFDTISLIEPAEITTQYTLENIACYGENIGDISVSVLTGISPFTYLWTTQDTTSAVDSLTAGTYRLTITDNSNCSIVRQFEITGPAMPLSFSSSIVRDTCSGSEKTITILAFGGTPEYSFLWSNGQASETLTITDTIITHYTVTITDANSCTIYNEYTVTIRPSGLNLQANITGESCMDKADGIIDIEVISGTPPYAYSWNTLATSDKIEQLSAGTFNVTVTDARTCSTIKTYSVAGSAQSCLVIWNTFTPNGDGKNDVWNIQGIEEYPNCKVEFYNQWGKKVFSSDGYSQPWDGTYNGHPLPAATYYYYIDLGSEGRIYSGALTIIK